MLGLMRSDPHTEPAGAGASRSVRSSGLRSDAERNRLRIIDAARQLYATGGLGVSMAAIAREAGVGKATLSRHFSDPQELIDAVFADRMSGYVEATERALAQEDPWEGFVEYVWRVCEMQADDRGFADLLTITFPTRWGLEADRARSYKGFLEVVRRAKRTGKLRSDFRPEDLVILLMANAGVLTATGDDAPGSWRRLVGHMLRSYAAPDVPLPLLPASPTPDEIGAAMTRHAASRSEAPAPVRDQ